MTEINEAAIAIKLVYQIAEIERLGKENETLKQREFLPMGDNHHNALKCPYCSGPLKDENVRLNKEIEQLKNGMLRLVFSIREIRDEILHADANVLDNDQVNYILGIIDSKQLTEATNEGEK